MKRLGLLILIFTMALSIPLAYFVWRTYRSLEQEEISQLRFFAETLFNEMEQEMATLVRREEKRAVDEYNYRDSSGRSGQRNETATSLPQTASPHESYILGYLQNNPDGSYETPLAPRWESAPPGLQPLVKRLEAVNDIFNSKRTAVLAEPVTPAPVTVHGPREMSQTAGFAEKYLDLGKSRRQKSHLGAEKKRIEPITQDQAVNLVQKDESRYSGKSDKRVLPSQARAPAREGLLEEAEEVSNKDKEGATGASRPFDLKNTNGGQLEVEVDPMQSVFIDEQTIFVFRRIAVNNRIYRQGFVLKIHNFMNHLVNAYFIGQPMARFARLDLSALDQKRQVFSLQAGAAARKAVFRLERRFPRPFSFLQASLTCETMPRSQGRKTLNIMVAGLGIIMLAGLFAIYQSARAVLELSERRSRFASSVTHELKTPLTNIRMYIEMLEQGIARSEEREQAYYKVLNSESGRLSRLINNVLEFSKLERKKLRLSWVTGTFEEVIDELKSVMQIKLRQEEFNLKVILEKVPPFEYDRELMLQVLINLLENSVKFAKSASHKDITLRVEPEGKWIRISVSDHGPGIPRHALKKVFDDFYRVDDSKGPTTRGTGIGLAFVKKAVTALNGKVRAEKNSPSGCNIVIHLPKKAA